MKHACLPASALILLGLSYIVSHQSGKPHQGQSAAFQVATAEPACTEEKPIPLAVPPQLQTHADLAGLNSFSSGQEADPEDARLRERRNESLSSLPNAEQKSLWKAFSEARREVRPIPKSRAQRAENLGYDFYALHPKQNMTIRFGSEGVQIVSSDRTCTEDDGKNPATAWQARMRLSSFAGGPVQANARPEKSDQRSGKVEYHHRQGLTEWFDNGVDGMEHGYTIEVRPANLIDGEDVTLEIALDGLDVTEQQHDDEGQALVFMDGEREVLSYSKLVVFDARGRELPATMKPTAVGFALAYNDSQAVYPITIDPLIVHEEAKLNRIDSAPSDYFGTAVAISGDSVVVGAKGDDDGGAESGSAYVFVRSGTTWVLHGKLTADDAEAGDEFGKSVAISGDSVVVGAELDDDAGTSSGSAYVFVRNGTSWSQQAKLTASDAAADNRFGSAVAMSGDSVIVGAELDDDGGALSGSAYVFVRGGTIWSQQGKLTADDAAAGDRFGISVAMSGDSVIVGAERNDDSGTSSGSAYVFIRNGSSWSQQSKLTAGDAAAGDVFGTAVAMSGDSVVVGANFDDDAGTSSGSAYVFVRSGTTWSQQAKLAADDAAAKDRFGTSVGISGDSVVVGAFLNDDEGSAYVFMRDGTTWSQQGKLTTDDAAVDDRFGISVGISGDSVVVGAERNDDGGTDSGSAYVFVRDGAAWSQQGKLLASDAGEDQEFGDEFGSSVAISGDTVVIGAARDDDAGTASGSAYVLVRSGTNWSQQAKLIAGDPGSFDEFGISVAISGDTIVVGAVFADAGDASVAGCAYVFERSDNTWSQQAKFTSDDPVRHGRFGASVAISGDSVAIGAHGDGHNADENPGSVFVFVRIGITWSQQAKLTADDTAANDLFGVSVAMSGDSLVVGAVFDDDAGSASGSAYVFVRSGTMWSQQGKLNADDGAAGDQFGHSVAISGESVVVGAVFDDDTAENSGSAYVFVRTGTSWSQQVKLTVEDAAAHDRFGTSVAISGDSIVVGAERSDDEGGNSGSAFVFVRSGTTWSQQVKITAGDAAAEDMFGSSVAISGDTVVVAAMFDDDGASDSGSVYVYRFSVTSTTELLVLNHLGVEILSGSDVPAFPGQLLGSELEVSFRLANAGQLDLDVQSVSLGGSDAGQFGLAVPDISSPVDLGSNESLDFTISFSPTGVTSGLRNAILIVASNDSDTPVFSVNLTGLGLSETGDADGDGMEDWGEFSLRGYGFVWDEPQINRVADFYSRASSVGLFTPAQLGIVEGSFFIVNPTETSVDLILELQQSLDLETYTPVNLDPAKLTVDGDGNIHYQLDTTADKEFFKAVWEGQ